MKTYLQRYDQKMTRIWHQEAKTVWSELISLGQLIRDEHRYTDAKDVAVAMMQRANQNIEIITNRLNEIGYRFADVDKVWIRPNMETLINLDYIEHSQGLMPLVVRTWFEVVGSVCLIGYHPKLSRYSLFDINEVNQPQYYSDPLVVESYNLLDGELLSYYSTDTYAFEIAPDSIHKAADSGGGPTSLVIPNPAFDAPLIDQGGTWDGNWTGIFFIQYLQTCFDWGGFPGLRYLPEREQPKEELTFLTKDLLPLI